MSYVHAIAVRNGCRSHQLVDKMQAGLEVCSLIACSSQTKGSCAQRFQSGTTVKQRFTFNTIKLETEIEINKSTIMANALTNNLLALNGSQFELKKYFVFHIVCEKKLQIKLFFQFFFLQKTEI